MSLLTRPPTHRLPSLLHPFLRQPTTTTTSPTPPTPTTPNIHIQHQQQTRHETTARRLRKMLLLPPAPFLSGPDKPTGSSGRSRTAKKQLGEGDGRQAEQGEEDRIVFTPPPSAPDVWQTPPIFLPRGDVRRGLWERREHITTTSPTPSSPSASNTTATTTQTQTQSQSAATLPRWPTNLPLPPAITPPQTKKYHLSPTDIAEMRSLRQADEAKWTRARLAERFQCSALFVGMVVQASEGRLRGLEREGEKVRQGWGERRRRARVERGRRREGWGVAGN